MIKVSNEDISINSSRFLDNIINSKSAIFLQDKFFTRSYEGLSKKAGRTYPYTVNIPKSIPELLKGDFTPAYSITINAPIMGKYGPMWFGKSSKGINLRFGYVNGDSRFVTDTGFMETINHGFLVGATGQGKSVTLNVVIMSLAYEYAPWEVKFVFLDPKLVEFKPYAGECRLPHTKAVAATNDSDFVISVLEDLVKEMKTINSILVKAGVQNIWDFEALTGLTLPRIVIVGDEIETVLKNAEKQVPKFTGFTGDFAKLGRNTGYHLFFASQNLPADFPQAIMNNITFRAAMGCDESVSEKILGNKAAVNNMGKRGRLIINTNYGRKSVKDNIDVRVPFMPVEPPLNMRKDMCEHLMEKAREFVDIPHINFYDENDIVYEEDHLEYLQANGVSTEKIILGEPSFVYKDKVFGLTLDGNDMENICVLCPSTDNQKRYFTMLRNNVMLMPGVLNNVACTNPMFLEQCGVDKLPSVNIDSTDNAEENSEFTQTIKVVNRRKLILNADNLAFNDSFTSEQNDILFYNLFEKGSEYDTELNRRRFTQAIGLLGNPNYSVSKSLGISTMIGEGKNNRIIEEAKICVMSCTAYGCANKKAKTEHFPKLFCWLLGAERLIGIGRDPSSASIGKLKKAMQDCTAVNVRFIIFITTIADCTDLKPAIRWYVMDGVGSKEVSRVNCESYPTQVSGILGVLFDTTAPGDNKCFKFKKMALSGEVLAAL